MGKHTKQQLNKAQKEFLKEREKSHVELYAEKMGYRTPVEILMDIANDSKTPNREIVQSSIALLPYVESKLPTKVDHSGEIEHTHTHLHTEALDKFDDFMQLNNDDVLEGEVVPVEHSTTK